MSTPASQPLPSDPAARRAELHVVCTATFTAEPLEDALAFWMAELGFEPRIEFAPYNQVFQQLLDPSSALGRNRGINAIAVRFEDWLQEHAELQPDAAEALAQRTCGELLAALRGAAQRSTTPAILWIDPSCAAPGATPERLALFARLEQELAAQAAGIAGVHVLAPAAVALYRAEPVHDPQGYALAQIPYSGVFFTALASAIARRIHAIQSPPIKVIALDCDNTLWTGVVGEDGPHGIRFSEANLALQRAVLHQQSTGVLLCLLSKNAEEDVLEVLDVRPDFLIRREHLVGWRIGWQPKALGIAALARELGLGLDSFVFIDDNPVECAEMRSAHPEVITLQLPAEHAVSSFLDHLWAFDRLQVTSEDRQRTQMYQQNAERVRLEQSAGTIADFIAQLELHVDIARLAAADIPRVAQLTQRTNQFNFTTVRRSEAEIAELARKGLECVRVHVTDRFGDYGLVGVMIFGELESRMRVDTFLLSCRVLGRGVEHAMLAHLAQQALARDLAIVEAPFARTRKNQPALEFLERVPSLGREEEPGGSVYRFASDRTARLVYEPGADAKDQLEFARTGGASGGGSAPTSGARAELLQRVVTRWSELAEICRAVEQSTSRARPQLQGALIAPRNPLEHDLAEIWKQVLRVDAVGVHDEFGALGGSSLMVAQLFAEIARRYGQRLPMTTILECPTIERLAERLREGQRPGEPRALRVLRPGTGEGRAVFLVHDGDGETLLYMNLARRLPADVSVYGLEPIGDARVPIRATTVPQMAAQYVDEVLSVQAQGPYRLGGMCAGGTIAFEMGLQLEARGQSVEWVALLDSADAQARRRPFLRSRRRLQSFASALRGGGASAPTPVAAAPSSCETTPAKSNAAPSSRWQRAAAKAANLIAYELATARRAAWSFVRFRALRRVLRSGAPVPAWLEQLSVRTVYDLAQREYHPAARLRGTVLLFRATSGEGADEPFTALFADPLLGWEGRAASPVQVHDLPGGHSTMLAEPQVDVLAAHLRARLS